MKKTLALVLTAALVFSLCPALADVSVETKALTDAQRLLRGYDPGSKSYVYINFGSYPFTKEAEVRPCLWRVLAIEDGYAFLLNEYIVDFLEFHTEKVDQPEWRDYEIFTVMNTTMLDAMFSPEEQPLLKDSDELGRLFMLDNREYMHAAYGFRAILTAKQPERKCPPTPYAMTRPKAYRNENGCTWYWSRTCRHTAAGGYEYIIGYNGHISMAGFLRVGGVRPCCRVDIGRLDHVTGSGTETDPYAFHIIP